MAKTRHCEKKTAWSLQCNHVTASKEWLRRHKDPAATGQRYYCKAEECKARYKTAWGTLIEIYDNAKENYYYMKAPVPDDHVHDILALAKQKEMPKGHRFVSQ